MSSQHHYILQWPELLRWDLKSARAAAFGAAHPGFRPMGEFVEDATEIVHPSREPDHNWPVYGVNNKSGVTLSHHQRGDAFNSTYKRIRKDWFFHNPTRANVGSLGRVPEVPADAITSPEYQVWRIKRSLLADFVEILIHLPFFLDLVECHRVGAVKERLFVENLLEIPIPVLSEGEQQAIVDRWRTAQRTISVARERAERKEVAITEEFSVDLGLSSVQAADVPKAFAAWWKDVERWGVQMVALNTRHRASPCFPEVRLFKLCRIGSGGTPSRRRPDYFDGGIPWVKTTEVVNDVIVTTEETLSEAGLRSSSAKLYPAGSLIVAMYGQGATRGRTAKLGIEAATNQACAVLFDFSPEIDPDFLWLSLITQYDAMRAMASGNNQPNLNAEMIANLRVPLPPKAEVSLGQSVNLATAEFHYSRAADSHQEPAPAALRMQCHKRNTRQNASGDRPHHGNPRIAPVAVALARDR
jgi:restriction endonuclease S subunit